MPNLIEKALAAKRESKAIEFKQGFDCDSKGEWCEIIKDLVAIANSGGGILVFGLGDTGEPVGTDLTKVAALDPADVSNKIGAYIGSNDFDFQIIDLKKNDKNLIAFVIGPAAIPYVFEKHGGYADPTGKQKSAFALGTPYFRHGAKSEPATNDDIRKSITRQIEAFRREWVEGVRKVVEAPAGSQVIIASPDASDGRGSNLVKLGNSADAAVVRLTRNTEGVTGTLMHEEISDALFDEINNVIGTNRLLSSGQNRFLLGVEIYYRIYAERQHVVQSGGQINQLIHTGISKYSPFLFWCSLLTDEVVAARLADLILWPRGVEVLTLMRITPLLGQNFYKWLDAKFTEKWQNYSQPPAFYWRLKSMSSKVSSDDPRLLASGLSMQTQLTLEDDLTKSVREIIGDQATCHALVSRACLEVFRGDKESKSVARDLDYLAHGEEIMGRARNIGEILKGLVGDRLPGDDVDVNRLIENEDGAALRPST